MIDLKGFLNQQSFAEKIEEMVLGGSTYFEAIIEFADECNKSPEEMMPFMSPVLLDKVRKSASDNGLIDLKEPSLDSFFGE
jgi:hypothetical protein